MTFFPQVHRNERWLEMKIYIFFHLLFSIQVVCAKRCLNINTINIKQPCNIWQGLASFFSPQKTKHGNKYCRLWSHIIFVQPLIFATVLQMQPDNMKPNECDRVPVKLYRCGLGYNSIHHSQSLGFDLHPSDPRTREVEQDYQKLRSSSATQQVQDQPRLRETLNFKIKCYLEKVIFGDHDQIILIIHQ